MNPFRNDFEWKSHFGTIDTSGCLIYVLNRKNFHNYWIMLATISGVILFISEGVLFHWDCCRSLGLLQICGIAADLWGGIAADLWDVLLQIPGMGLLQIPGMAARSLG